MENFIPKRLNRHETIEQIIADLHFVLERNNTVQQTTRKVNDIGTNFHKGNKTVLLLLDIEKAFNKVWFDRIIYKMINNKYLYPIIRLIFSYLYNRNLKVIVNRSKSGKRKMRVDVSQGSVIVPKLFNIYL